MSLLQHAMNVAGFTPGTLRMSDIQTGMRFEKVQWDGCMATVRNVIDRGVVIRQQRSPHNQGRYPGFLVYYGNREQWEPAAHFRMVDGKLEVWV